MLDLGGTIFSCLLCVGLDNTCQILTQQDSLGLCILVISQSLSSVVGTSGATQAAGVSGQSWAHLLHPAQCVVGGT